MSSEEQIGKDKFYMGHALMLAEEAFKKGEVPVGAVIVCRDKIIARAYNLTEALIDVTALTMSANELGGKYLQDCTLYVTVEPCVMCAGALGWAQIRRVVYGCSDEKRGFSAFAPQALHKRTIVTKGVREEECKLLMQQFFKQRR